MKDYLVIILIMAVNSAFAKTSGREDSMLIIKDTIHVSGNIIYSSGEPAKFVFVIIPLHSNRNYKIVAGITDSEGRFNVKGLRFKDTLIIQASNYSRKIINNGSRTLRIVIPNSYDISVNNVIKIEAREISKKDNTHKAFYEDCCTISDYAYFQSEVPAEFPFGDQKLHDFIKSKLIYPRQSLRDNIEGEVIVQFKIKPDGTSTDFIVTSGLNNECNEAAINSLKQMPKWRPAILYGRPVDSTQNLAIDFEIRR